MKHSKGFTIIELLIAMLLLMFVMIGFLGSLLNYIKFSLDARMKDTASKAIRDWSGYLESLPYNATLISPSTYTWDNASCDLSGNCTFEVTDSDGDGIPDFYDPYSGNNSSFSGSPTSTAGWLLISPTTVCSPCPLRQYTLGRRRVYVGITIARLRPQGKETGKAFGITAWYFSPIDGRYKYASTTLIKGKP